MKHEHSLKAKMLSNGRKKSAKPRASQAVRRFDKRFSRTELQAYRHWQAEEECKRVMGYYDEPR